MHNEECRMKILTTVYIPRLGGEFEKVTTVGVGGGPGTLNRGGRPCAVTENENNMKNACSKQSLRDSSNRGARAREASDLYRGVSWSPKNLGNSTYRASLCRWQV